MEWLPRLFPGPACEGSDFWRIPRLTGNQNGVNLKWKPRFYPAYARGGGGGGGSGISNDWCITEHQLSVVKLQENHHEMCFRRFAGTRSNRVLKFQISTWPPRKQRWENLLDLFQTRVSLLYPQSAFYPWSAVCSLHFTPGLQSAVRSLRFTLTAFISIFLRSCISRNRLL